jgi:hypothetical protein
MLLLLYRGELDMCLGDVVGLLCGEVDQKAKSKMRSNPQTGFTVVGARVNTIKPYFP